MILYADGFVLGYRNPSKLGGGYTVTDTAGNVLENKTIYKEHFTNNEAELRACLAALMLSNNRDTVIVDSKNTISWVSNPFKKKQSRHDLDDIKIQCYELLQDKSVKLVWKSRDKNKAGIFNENNGFDNIDTAT